MGANIISAVLLLLLALIPPPSAGVREDSDLDAHDDYIDGPDPHNATSPPKVEEKLSTTVSGQRSLRSMHDTYLRAWEGLTIESEWNIGLAPQKTDCEKWTIEDHHGKVALKAFCSGKYLRAFENHFVLLAPEALHEELWTPVKNDDGSYSFRSAHDTWLRATPRGLVALQWQHARNDEKFWLETWTEPMRKTITPSTTRPSTELSKGEVALGRSGWRPGPARAHNTDIPPVLNSTEADREHFDYRPPNTAALNDGGKVSRAWRLIIVLSFVVMVAILLFVIATVAWIVKRKLNRRKASNDQRNLVVGYTGVEQNEQSTMSFSNENFPGAE